MKMIQHTAKGTPAHYGRILYLPNTREGLHPYGSKDGNAPKYRSPQVHCSPQVHPFIFGPLPPQAHRHLLLCNGMSNT